MVSEYQLTPKEALEQFIVGNEQLEHLQDMLAEFNVFEALRIELSETRHSAFIAWLLDPNGSHGVGIYFLNAFLQCCSLAECLFDAAQSPP